MSRIYKSSYVKINEPRKLENIFPAHFPSVEKTKAEDSADDELFDSSEGDDSEEIDGAEEKTLNLSEAEEEATRVIEEAKELYKNIVSEANREAQEMTEQANDEAKAVTERAYTEGYNRGIQDAKERIGSLVDEAQGIRDFMEARREGQMREIEVDTINLIMDISRKVIGCELEQNEKAVISLVKSALSKSAFTEKASLRVSPEDFAIVDSNRINILRSVEGLSALEVVEDEAIPKGSCIVDTPSGEINASIDVQLKELEKIFDFVLKNDL